MIPRAIVDEWSKQGYERGAMGYPTSDVFCGLLDDGCGQHFQGGSAYARGPVQRGYQALVHFVPGPIRDAWVAQGWERGRLFYPMLPAQLVRGRTVQLFYGGSISVHNGLVRVNYR
ncbi:LGFP repeat-containing protein [Modestobacter sp. SYSU DS0875]